MGVSIVMWLPPNGWFIMDNPIYKWMITGGTPISGTPKSCILIRVSLINHPFWDTSICGKPPYLKPRTFQTLAACPRPSLVSGHEHGAGWVHWKLPGNLETRDPMRNSTRKNLDKITISIFFIVKDATFDG